jgi:adenosine deaminase
MIMSQELGWSWFEQLPKIELHLHLEGAIPYNALWHLVQKYGSDIPSEKALKEKFKYKDFAHFIETWVWKNQFLREYEDFTFLAEAVARDLASQKIYYAEIYFSPADFWRQKLETQRIAEAIRRGLEKVEEIEIALVVDLVRDFGSERAKKTLAEVNEVKQLGIIGVGIGGSEQDYPPETFEEVYARARKLGFRTSAHAGEAAGPQSVWGAIRCLQVDRIGHGTRVEEDEQLLDYLVEHRTPIEMCPLSNVRTGVVKSYAEHPVRRYFDRGINMSVNTDDPKMFGNSLAEEFKLLVDEKGFAPEEIKSLVLGSVEMSWMSDDKKQAMTARINRDPVWAVNIHSG